MVLARLSSSLELSRPAFNYGEPTIKRVRRLQKYKHGLRIFQSLIFPSKIPGVIVALLYIQRETLQLCRRKHIPSRVFPWCLAKVSHFARRSLLGTITMPTSTKSRFSCKLWPRSRTNLSNNACHTSRSPVGLVMPSFPNCELIIQVFIATPSWDGMARKESKSPGKIQIHSLATVHITG